METILIPPQLMESILIGEIIFWSAEFFPSFVLGKAGLTVPEYQIPGFVSPWAARLCGCKQPWGNAATTRPRSALAVIHVSQVHFE